MEEILVVFFQLFFEVGVQLLGSPGLDFSLGSKGDKGCLLVVLHAFLGGGLGFVSTLISPKLIIGIAALRIANLLISPLLAGGISWLMAKKLTKKSASDAFVHASLFAFMFGAARLAFCQH